MEERVQASDELTESLRRVADPRSRALLDGLLALEAAWVRGELPATLQDARLRSAVGVALASCYECLLTHARLAPTERRQVSFERLVIEACEELVQPRREFEAQPAHVTSAEARELLRIGREVTLVIEQEGGAVRLRHDQWTSARFWGVGLRLSDGALQATAEATLRQRVSRELTRALHDLEEIEQHFATRPSTNSPVVPPLKSRQVERLMCDVLNEDERCAYHSRLVEDFFTATDLRVHVVGVERPHGSRVQVSSSFSRDHHTLKLERMLHGSEVSMLSPYSLADAIKLGAISVLGIDADEFWIAFPGSNPHDPRLALGIWQVIVAALDKSSDDARGPLAALPPVLREFVRRFVAKEARWTTENLRRREARGDPFRVARRKLRHLRPPYDATLDLVRELDPPGADSALTSPKA